MKTKKATGAAALLAATVALSACGSAGPGADMAERDPYESWNRAIFKHNVNLDTYILRPSAQAYNFITPELFRYMFGNVVNHFDSVSDFANYVFQGEVDSALNALGRLTINTFIGAAGLLDPATEFGLLKEDTDFGITMGKYGVEEGAYLVLPILGPSTTRDTAGSVVEFGLDPKTYMGIMIDGTAISAFNISVGALTIVDRRDRNADLIDDLLYESADSYVSIRSIYLQRRDALIRGNTVEEDALPDIFDKDVDN